jgi:tetratricopeptide (TPR) repeat protein
MRILLPLVLLAAAVSSIAATDAAKLEKMHSDAEKLVIQNKFREAIRAYTDIILYEPDDEVAYTNMGHAYMILGDYKRARDAFQNALTINPDNDVAYLGLQKIIDPDSLNASNVPDTADPNA